MSSLSSDAPDLGETRVTAGGHSPAAANAASAGLSSGERIGRYLVVEEIGRGGMGVVLRAYDPRLNREVALKSVHAETLDADAQLRMLREAQAMAKLSHPNVVPVYDVMGAAGERRVVLAMEYVRGVTLQSWLEEPTRSWQDVVEIFVAAGRGLAAAHRAGLLHRDFKPANVLVGRDGRARVTDFGLAKVHLGAGTPSDGSRSANDAFEGGAAHSELSTAGMIAGTPRYMAPEQHAGEELSSASDQYAFCVALWESLARRRMFDVTGEAALASAKQLGPPAWPSDVVVPRVLSQAVERGLMLNPNERWPTMEALLDVIAAGPGHRRRRRIVALTSVAAVGFGGAAVWQVTSEQLAQRCSGAREQLAGVWDANRRAAIGAAVAEVNAPFAHDLWQRVETSLADYAAGWVAAHTDACEATAVRDEQPAAVMDLRMACLHRAKVELRAVTDLFAHADAQVMWKAHALVASLPSLSRCADIEALRAEVSPPSSNERQHVEDIRIALAEARALGEAGKYPEALARVSATAERLREVAYGPVATEVLFELGTAQHQMGLYADSERQLTAALRSALAHKQWRDAYSAAAALAAVVGSQLLRPSEGFAYAETAKALLSSVDAQEQANLHAYLGAVADASGRYDDAEVEARAAMALRAAALGDEHPLVAAARSTLANALASQGRLEDAEQQYLLTIAALEDGLGPDHPEVAVARLSLTSVLEAQSLPERAEREARTAMAALHRSVGGEHPLVAEAHVGLARVLNTQQRHEDAVVELDKAVRLQEKLLGPDHPRLAMGRHNLGVLLIALGRHDEAQRELSAAVQQQAQTLGLDHPDTIIFRSNLARALTGQGRYEEAAREFEAVLTAWGDAPGPRRDVVLAAREGLGFALLELGHAHDATPVLEQVWAEIGDDEQVRIWLRAETAFTLARALWRTPAQRARARRLAERARTLYTEAQREVRSRQVEAWLRKPS